MGLGYASIVSCLKRVHSGNVAGSCYSYPYANESAFPADLCR